MKTCKKCNEPKPRSEFPESNIYGEPASIVCWGCQLNATADEIDTAEFFPAKFWDVIPTSSIDI